MLYINIYITYIIIFILHLFYIICNCITLLTLLIIFFWFITLISHFPHYLCLCTYILKEKKGTARTSIFVIPDLEMPVNPLLPPKIQWGFKSSFLFFQEMFVRLVKGVSLVISWPGWYLPNWSLFVPLTSFLVLQRPQFMQSKALPW